MAVYMNNYETIVYGIAQYVLVLLSVYLTATRNRS